MGGGLGTEAPLGPGLSPVTVEPAPCTAVRINSKIVLIDTAEATDGPTKDGVDAAFEGAVDGDVVEELAPAPVDLGAEAGDMVVIELAA